jgi:phosphohistidine phosphatase
MDDVTQTADRVSRADRNLVLVGHLPFMERLAAYLLAGNADLELLHFRTGGVACLSRQPNGWRLEWFVAPQLLKG